MKPSIMVCVGAVLLALLSTPAVAGAHRWLDDTLISSSATGIDRLMVDVKEDNSCWYALVSGNQIAEHIAWHRSTDSGASWTPFYQAFWNTADVAIGGAYGFDRVMYVWQPYESLWYRVLDPMTGGVVSDGIFVNESPRKAHCILVDSNAEVGPGQVFIACAHLVDPGSGQATLKAYRTLDLGLTWTDFSILDQGPAGDPDYFGDVDLCFAVAGYPYFHVVYRKAGRIWHVRTADAGQHWDAPTELIVNVSEGTQVSCAAVGIYVIAVGESTGSQVVYCYSDDAGATWSNAMLIDGGETSPRLPSVCRNYGNWTVLYRKADGRLAYRTSSNPATPGNWSDEAYATWGTTAVPISTRMSGHPDGNVGVVYARLDDSGRPYFASRLGEPSAVGDEPTWSMTETLQAYPSPSSGPVTVLLRQRPESAALGWRRACVLDASGRVVVHLTDPGAAADRLVRWDGRDAVGRLVPSGAYTLYLTTPDGPRSAPIVILR